MDKSFFYRKNRLANKEILKLLGIGTMKAALVGNRQCSKVDASDPSERARGLKRSGPDGRDPVDPKMEPGGCNARKQGPSE